MLKILLLSVLASCKTGGYKADFDIKAHQKMNFNKSDKLFIVAGDNNESTKKVVESSKNYYKSLNHSLTDKREEAKVILTWNSLVVDKKRIDITGTIKEDAKRLIHGEKPIKKELEIKHVWIKAKYEKPNGKNKPEVSTSEMEVEDKIFKNKESVYVNKFLNTVSESKENVKKTFNWK